MRILSPSSIALKIAAFIVVTLPYLIDICYPYSNEERMYETVLSSWNLHRCQRFVHCGKRDKFPYPYHHMKTRNILSSSFSLFTNTSCPFQTMLNAYRLHHQSPKCRLFNYSIAFILFWCHFCPFQKRENHIANQLVSPTLNFKLSSETGARQLFTCSFTSEAPHRFFSLQKRYLSTNSGTLK